MSLNENSVAVETFPAKGQTYFKPLNTFSIVLAVLGLFFLLTNGIPLIQWGWIHSDCSKKFCLRMMRPGFLVPAVIYIVWYLRWRETFLRLSPVRLMKKISTAPLGWVLFGLFLIYCAMLIPVSFVRHSALETRAFDLGIFAQTVWNTMQGHFLFSSIKEDICLLGDHFSPVLAALVPFYKIWPDPRNLLILQTVAAAGCLFPIASIAKEKTGSSLAAFFFALMYFFYLPTRNALHEDFHPEVLAEPFLLLAFIFLEKKRIVWFLIASAAAISTKENMLGIFFMMGFYAFVWKRMRWLGVTVMTVSFLVFVLDVKWIIPYFRGKPYLYEGFYTHLSNGSPGALAKALFQTDGLEYLMKVFFPFLFLPFFHLPTFVLTLPILIQNLLSNNPVMRSFSYHYSTGLTPFVFVSSIYGFCAVLKRWRWLKTRQNLFLMILLAVNLARSGPCEYFYFTDSLNHTSRHKALIREKLAAIPQDKTVLTHNNFIPQAINRRRIYQFDYRNRPTKGESAVQYQADYVIFDKDFLEPGTLPVEEVLKELMGLGYKIEYESQGFYILRKGAA